MACLDGALIAALLAGFAAGVLNHARVLRILRERHPQTWRTLGEPTLIRNNSIANSRKVRSFLRKREHESLRDSELGRVVRIGKYLEWGYFLLISMFAVRFVLR